MQNSQYAVPAIGWCVVTLSVAMSCVLAHWGVNELFHEGWWASSFAGNLWFCIPFLTPAIIPAALAVVAVRWPAVGGTMMILAGVAILLWWTIYEGHREVSPRAFLDLVRLGGMVVVLTGVGYLVGRPRPAWLASALLIGLPLGVVVVFGAEPVWRVSHRPNDGFLGERVVQGNGVALVWAPAGPGWPARSGVKYAEAERIVSHLVADGSSCAEVPQNIWRLPTVDEAVRSLTRAGKNAGGQWDPVHRRATYRVRPDKEPPLWNVHSQVIYWWTSSETPDRDAVYGICYNGFVSDRGQYKPMGFRAVKEPAPPMKPPVDAGQELR